MPSEIRSIGPTIRRLAKGTIDLVRWRAPVQLLKYATRTDRFRVLLVYLINYLCQKVNTGYPVGALSETRKPRRGNTQNDLESSTHSENSRHL